MNLTIIAIICIILPVGPVKKNEILTVDFAREAERKEGMAPEKAIYEAALLRFRPIVMTAVAAPAGGFASGAGHGSGLRAAPASRDSDHGRLDFQQDAHLVYYSRYIPP